MQAQKYKAVIFERVNLSSFNKNILMMHRPTVQSDYSVYLCKFKLKIQELDIQSYFASSFSVLWKDRQQKILATSSSVQKGKTTYVKYNEIIQIQTFMIFNKKMNKYIEKDTFITVQYALSSNKKQVKELGRIQLKLAGLMEQYGQNTVRKGQEINSQPKRIKSPTKPYPNTDTKVKRLQNCNYNAKLKFKAQCVQSIINKTPLKSLQKQQFSELFNEEPKANIKKKPSVQKVQTKIINKPVISRQKRQNISRKKIQQPQKSNVPPKLFSGTLSRGNNSDKNQKSKLIQQLQKIKSNQQHLLTTIQHLEETNKAHLNKIQELKKQKQQFEDEMIEKQTYMEQNMAKLQELDQLKYQLIQITQYAAYLQNRLESYGQNIEKCQKRLSLRQSSRFNLDSDNLKQSTIIRQSFPKFGTASQDKVRESRNRQDSSFMATPSQFQLSNSEMKQGEGSTARMQSDLNFIQIQLGDIKGELEMLKEKYESQCKSHMQTKGQLFRFDQKFTQMEHKKQLQIHSLYQQMNVKQKNHKKMEKDFYQQTQKYQQLDYQFSLRIKEQKNQIQSVKSSLRQAQSKIQAKTRQNVLVSDALKDLKKKHAETSKQLIEMRRNNNKLSHEIKEFKDKQTMMKQYLSTLELQINQVYKIVEEKQKSQQQLSEQIQLKIQETQNLKHELLWTNQTIESLKSRVSNLQKQVALEKSRSKVSLSKNIQSAKEKQLAERISLLQDNNKDLISKNREFIQLINKNATNMIDYEKQKKQNDRLKQDIAKYKYFKEQNQKIKDTLKKCQKQREQVKRQHNLFVQKLKNVESSCSQQISQKQDYLQKAQNRNNQLEEANNQLTIKLEELEKSIEQKNKNNQKNQAKIAKLTRQKKAIEDNMKRLEQKLKKHQSQITDYESLMQTNESTIKQLQNRIKTIQQTQTVLESKYGNIDPSIEKNGTLNLQQKHDPSHLEQQSNIYSIDKLQTKNNYLQNENFSLKDQIRQLQDKIQNSSDNALTKRSQEKDKKLEILLQFIERHKTDRSEMQMPQILHNRLIQQVSANNANLSTSRILSLSYSLQNQRNADNHFHELQQQQLVMEKLKQAKIQLQKLKLNNFKKGDAKKNKQFLETLRPLQLQIEDLLNVTQSLIHKKEGI